MFFRKYDQKRLKDVENAVYTLERIIKGDSLYSYDYLQQLYYHSQKKPEPSGLSSNVNSLKNRMTAVEEKLDLLLAHLGLQHVPSHDCPAKLVSDGKDHK